jgi:hypothetical protein
MSSAALKLRPVELCFAVSNDEGWASLTVVHGDQTVELGPELHHHCLVQLARRRVADAAAGVRCAEQGWLTRDALRIMLGIAPSELNGRPNFPHWANSLNDNATRTGWRHSRLRSDAPVLLTRDTLHRTTANSRKYITSAIAMLPPGS